MLNVRTGRILFVLLLASPLVSLPGFGYDGLRLPFALALGAAMVALSGVGGAWRNREPLALAALAFGAAHLVALPGVIDPWAAARVLMTLAAGLAVFFGVRAGPRMGEERIEWILTAIPTVGIGVAVAGLWGPIFSGDRAVGFEGNSNYAGTLAALLAVPAAAGALIPGPTWRRILSGIAALLLAGLLAASQSRGGALGLVAGIAVICVVLFRVGFRRSGIALALLALLTVGTAFMQGAGRSSRGTSPVVRLEIWRSALRMFAGRPWIGGGPGQFAVRYPPHRGAVEYRLSNPDPTAGFTEVEDPHSSWVQVGVETGIPGLLSWLALIGIAAWRWRRASFAETDPGARILLAGLGGGAAVFLVSGCFNTLTFHVSHTVCFWAFLGLIDRDVHKPTGLKCGHVAALVLIVGAGGALMTGLSERSLNTAMQTADPEKRRAGIDEALGWQAGSWRALFQRGTVTPEPGKALEFYRRAAALRPWHAPSLANGGAAAIRTGKDGEGKALLERAVEAAPYWHVPYYNLGLLAARGGRLEAAQRRFREALARYPAHGESRYALGEVALLRGETGRALEHFRKARALGIPVGDRLRAERPGAASTPAYAEFFR